MAGKDYPGRACRGHFPGKHNRGHHLAVSTREDSASSRMGESIYRFVLREIPGASRRAWQIERDRPAKRDLPPWHYSNPILLAWIPPLRFRVMNPRLMALSHVRGDLDRANI